MSSLTLVLGRKGTGKTTKVKSLLRRKSHVLVYDPNDEYRELEPAKEPPPTPTTGSVWIRALEVLIGGGPLKRLVDDPPCEKPDWRHVVRTRTDFDRFLALVEKADGYTVAVDEAHFHWRQHRERLDELVQTLRHRDQDWILVSHRAAWVPYSILSQLDRVYLFQMTLTSDLEAFRRQIADIDIEAVRKLGVGKCLEIDVAHN